MTTAPNLEQFRAILNAEIKAIHEREAVPIAMVEAELGHEIGKSGKTIEEWRTRKNRTVLPHFEDLEMLAKALRSRGGLQGDLYKEFLIAGGHPNVDKLVQPSRVDEQDLVEHFIGREAELKELKTRLQPGQKVYLCGPGGVGKSSLVAELIKRLSPNKEPPEHFPDGIVYYNFYGGHTIEDAFRYIAQFFGIADSPQTPPRDAARQALRNRQALLLLDGTEEVQGLGKIDEIRGGCGVLLVTRYQQKNAVKLNVLPIEQAIKLLQDWSTEKQGGTEFHVWPDNPEVNHTIAKEICELVGSLPLALRLAGSYMVRTSTKPSEFLELLMTTPLSVLEEEKRQHESVLVLLEKSAEKLREDAHIVLAVIGLLGFDPFSDEIVANALETSSISTVSSLGELVKFSMVKRFSDGRYQAVHRLIHTYAKEHLAAPAESIIRLAIYYTTLSTEQSKVGVKGYIRLDAERTHMSAVLDRCVHQKEWILARDLVSAIGSYLTGRGYSTEAVPIYEVGLIVARTLNDRQAEKNWLGRLAPLYANLSQLEKAVSHLEQALAIAREIGDRQGENLYLGSLGTIYTGLGNIEQANMYFQQALVIAREIGDRKGEGNVLEQLGTMFTNLKQYQPATENYQQALAIAREIGDRKGEKTRLMGLAFMYYVMEMYQAATDYYHKALAINQEDGDLHGEALVLLTLGELYGELDQVEQANMYFQQALVIAREIGDRRMEGVCLSRLGAIYANLGQLEKAVSHLEQALRIAREMGDRGTELFCLACLFEAYNGLGRYEEATDAYQKASELSLDNPDNMLTRWL